MNDRLPNNLALLYDAFGQDVMESIWSGDTFTVEGVEFVCKYAPESTADRFFIVKTLGLVEQYRELCRRFAGGAIFELGIAEGGSTALLALLAEPRKLIAVDLEPEPLPALEEFIGRRGLSDVVRPYFGVDQTDRARLHEILDVELPDEPLDLVIDDASHLLDATRASFEALFPRLRPGGLYLIEDWNSAHILRDVIAAAFKDTSAPDYEARLATFREALAKSRKSDAPPVTPLSHLALELVLARASSTGACIDEVAVNEFWLVIRRGPGELDPATFRLADLYTDHFGFLPSAPG